MAQKLKVLLIEDNPGDARLLQEELLEARNNRDSQIAVDLRWINLLSTSLA